MNGKQTPSLMLHFQLCLSSSDREKIMYEEACLKFVWKFGTGILERERWKSVFQSCICSKTSIMVWTKVSSFSAAQVLHGAQVLSVAPACVCCGTEELGSARALLGFYVLIAVTHLTWSLISLSVSLPVSILQNILNEISWELRHAPC